MGDELGLVHLRINKGSGYKLAEKKSGGGGGGEGRRGGGPPQKQHTVY